MMISTQYCLTMARYNAWQNKQLKACFEKMDKAELEQDRGGFFGSILATANHLLWGDMIWMSRLANLPRPEGGISESTAMTKSREDWEIARFRLDGDMLLWAERLRAIDLAGDLRWYSGAVGADMVKPVSLCVAHMFNHQTHHRGQIHAMLTAAGATAPVTDLFIMPEDGPWL